MKKWFALVLSAVLFVSLLAGCGNTAVPAPSAAEDPALVQELLPDEQQSMALNPDATTEPVVENNPASQSAQAPLSTGDSLDGRTDIAYVLIYNPALWDEKNTDSMNNDLNEKLNTGTLEFQIDPNMRVRADLEEAEPEFTLIAQNELGALPEDMELDPNAVRAGGLPPIYELGDTHEFYIGHRELRPESLTCVYAGESCYIWTLEDSISAEQAGRYGKEFDEVIYPADTEIFGSARFCEDGGKVHILYYDFGETSKSYLGFFRPRDLFSAADLSSSPEDAENYRRKHQLNFDHAIIHINSRQCSNPKGEAMVFSTQAHEFQHLICFTDYIESSFGGYADTWLNEAMSGYVEEKLYPGTKSQEGHFASLLQSALIRCGQSLYNFKTLPSSPLTRQDIGVYGSVFLFSNYLEAEAGPDIFHRIHDYYRDGANSDLSTPAALYATVPADFRDRIEQTYVYPAGIHFDSPAREWTSKLALDYYLSHLSYDSADPASYAQIRAQALLYDELDPTLIEGGGRVLVATLNGSFVIPEDADDGLLYIGLDSDFRPITGICSK